MTKILIIDDEKSIRSTLREILEYEKFEVEEAADGAGGIECVKNNRFDVILCDIKMPKMDGIAAMGEIYRIRPDARVILSSGFNEEELCERVTDQAPSGFIRKPYSMSLLETEINRVIQVKSH